MSLDALPDHYKALGIDKHADAATIKKTYRKLVLTCHPDKVTDPALKAQKQDEFHQIQQAYETLNDDTRRATYEAELKLAQLRREKLARAASGSTLEPKTAHFDVKTTGGASYTRPTRYATEERRPSGTAASASSRAYEHDDERYDNRRKTDDSYSTSSRPGPSARSSREKYDKYEKEPSSSRATDRTRSSATKARDSDRRDRTARFPVDSEGSSADEKRRYEREYKRRSAEDEERRRDDRRHDGEYKSRDDYKLRGDYKPRDEYKTRDDYKPRDEYKTRDDYKPREEYKPRHDDYENTSPRKLSVQEKGEDDAIRYMDKSRDAHVHAPRPSPVRTTSRDYYEPSTRSSRHREVRPDPAPRRSSARPTQRPVPSRRDTDRGLPELVDWDDRRPSFKQSTSSPADLRIPPPTPQRAHTDSAPRDYRRPDRSPTRFPGLSRSATMPTVPVADSPSPRRDPKVYVRPSGLRNEANGSPERDAYSSIPAPQSTSKTSYYAYNPADGGVKPMDPPPHRTILREPERTRHHSPEPLSKPPIGPNRPGLHSAKTYTPSRSSRQSSPVRDDRDRGRSNNLKFGEIPSDYQRRRPMPERQSSYSPQDVSYAPTYRPEDIRYASREAYPERKPGMSRTTTSVY